MQGRTGGVVTASSGNTGLDALRRRKYREASEMTESLSCTREWGAGSGARGDPIVL